MCEYCKEPEGKFITDELFKQSRIQCWKSIDGERKRYMLSVNNGAYAEINYCPMCGRKLKEHKNDR